MGKLRLVFRKDGRAVYISHLDLLRTFQRVFLRQGLVLRHSQGFHPHPIVSFALPLSVGQSSDCEILDFEVTEDLDGRNIPELLNPYMPDGVCALTCYEPTRPVRDLVFLKCRVEFIYDGGIPEGAVQDIACLLSRESLVIQKRTKRKELADVDLRPMIRRFTISGEGDTLVWDAVVAAQNPGLNPALLATAVEKYLPHLKPDFVRVHRVAFLDGQERPFV